MMPTTMTTIVDQQSLPHPFILTAMSTTAPMILCRSMIRHWLVVLWALSVLIGFAALLHCSSRAAAAATDTSSDASSASDDNPWLLVALVWLASLSYLLLDLALVTTVLLWCHARLYWTGTSVWANVAYAGAYYYGYYHDDDQGDENGIDDDVDYWAVVEYCGSPPPLTAFFSQRERRNGDESSRMRMASSGSSVNGSLPLLEPLLTTVEVDEGSSAPDEAAIKRRRPQPLIVHRKRLHISRSEYNGVTTMAPFPNGGTSSFCCSTNTVQIRMLANQPDTAISLGVLRREMRFRGVALLTTLGLGLLCLLAVTHYTPRHLLLSSPQDDDDDDELSFLSSSSSCALWASFWYNLLPRLIVLPTFVPIADAILHDLARTRQREDFSSSVVVDVTTTTTDVTRSGGTAPFPVLV